MNKNTLNVVLLLLLALAFGCTTKSNMQPEGNWELSAPKPIAPQADEGIDLDEVFPSKTVDFEWREAVNTADFIISYSVVLVRDTATSYENPLLEVQANENGKDVTVNISHETIDRALAQACYSAGSTAKVKWGVKAQSLSRVSFATSPIQFKRFSADPIPDQMYLLGTATEAGSEISEAIPMKVFKDAEGNETFFETITALKKEETFEFVSAKEEPAFHYGLHEGKVVLCGSAITATEDGVFRVALDLKNQTLSLEKINHVGIVGTPIEGEWGGDVALPYQGNGLFQDTVSLLKEGGFVLRIDGDWGRMYKQTPGTTNLVYEPYADVAGLEKEDLQNSNIGEYIVSFDFLGNGYTYSFEEVETDTPAPGPIEAPETLFLIPSDGAAVIELIKDESVFTSPYYLALQSSVTYTLNSEADGSGHSYSLLGQIGETENPDGDNVKGAPYFIAEAGEINVVRDQAYRLTIDFDAPKVEWQYYNIKLFHWLDGTGEGWEARLEVPLEYEHPYKFKMVNQDLKGGHDSKFNSPWEVEYGVSDASGSTDDATATSGTTTNKALVDEGVNVSNFKFIASDGTYSIVLEIANDYTTATYSID
ncbi:SusE domain-containing protein [Flammeovirga sp. SJP92]|uniref:SusE domain-containing protein n=1 Tax=Flammeovirga sp. SJP92 TaxID=1775430 RepID=UPI0007875FD6|nr:hypothetical protein [Flammeovirga sp. SJP92]KXX70802.1 hypothetical protein AVL50_11500 [Flammeovirga sp. SJP92]